VITDSETKNGSCTLHYSQQEIFKHPNNLMKSEVLGTTETLIV